jgi:hypothetical protein
VKRERTLERIMAAFAEAVAGGDYERAEGWLAVARFSQDRISAADAPARAVTRGTSQAGHRQKA